VLRCELLSGLLRVGAPARGCVVVAEWLGGPVRHLFGLGVASMTKPPVPRGGSMTFVLGGNLHDHDAEPDHAPGREELPLAGPTRTSAGARPRAPRWAEL
jgi:hypothetical protein